MDESLSQSSSSIDSPNVSSYNSDVNTTELLDRTEISKSVSEPFNLQQPADSIKPDINKGLEDTDSKRVPETGSLRDLHRVRTETQANRTATSTTMIDTTSSSVSDQSVTNFNRDSKSDDTTISKTGANDFTSKVVMRRDNSHQSGSPSIFASDPIRQSILPSRRKQFRFVQPQQTANVSSGSSSATDASAPGIDSSALVPPSATQIFSYLDWVTLCETLLNDKPPDRTSAAQQERGEAFLKAVDKIEKALLENPRIALSSEPFSGNTVLHRAARNGYSPILKPLSEVIAKTGAKIDANAVNNMGFTPLHVAYIFSQDTFATELQKHFSVDPTVRDFYGRPPHHYKQQFNKQSNLPMGPSRTYYVRPPPNSTTFQFPSAPAASAASANTRRSRVSLHTSVTGPTGGVPSSGVLAAPTPASSNASNDASTVAKGTGTILHVEVFGPPNVIKKRRRVYDKWVQSDVFKRIQKARESRLIGSEPATELPRPESEARESKPKAASLARAGTISGSASSNLVSSTSSSSSAAASALAKLERTISRKGSFMKIFGFGGHHHKKPIIESSALGGRSSPDGPAPPLPPRNDKKTKSPSKEKLKPIDAANPAQQPKPAEPPTELQLEFQKRKLSGAQSSPTRTPVAVPVPALSATSPPAPAAPAAEPATTPKHERGEPPAVAQLASPAIVVSSSAPEAGPGDTRQAGNTRSPSSPDRQLLRISPPKNQRARTPSPPRPELIELTNSPMRKSLSADHIAELEDEGVSAGTSSRDTLLNEGGSGAARPTTLQPPELLVSSSSSAESSEDAAADSSLTTPDFAEESPVETGQPMPMTAAEAGVTFLGARKRPSVDLLSTLHEEAENDEDDAAGVDGAAQEMSASDSGATNSPMETSLMHESPRLEPKGHRVPRITPV